MRSDLRAFMIVVWYGRYQGDKYGWGATLHYQDARWMESGTVEGNVHTRYCCQTLPVAIDAVLEVAATFNLKLADFFTLCHHEEPVPPSIKEQIIAEANRRGWHSYASQLPARSEAHT